MDMYVSILLIYNIQYGTTGIPNYLILQGGENIVEYSTSGLPIYNTQSVSYGLWTPSYFIMQKDGNIVLYDTNKIPQWLCSDTFGVVSGIQYPAYCSTIGTTQNDPCLNTPTRMPLNTPSTRPVMSPSTLPTVNPTLIPSFIPTQKPSFIPSFLPTSSQTCVPSQHVYFQ